MIAKLKEARAKSLKFAEETKLPLKAHTLDHPFPVFNTLNAYQWLIYIPLHNIRHNKQIEEVKSDPNFPAKKATPSKLRRTEMSFTRMDQGTTEDWMAIGGQCAERQSRMPAIIKSMLRQLEEQVDGFAVNQLQHGLQTATRALRDGASEELTVAALCHDIGKVISLENHPAIAAEILKPYVSQETYEIIRTHQDFQGKHYYALMGRDPDARRKHESEPLVRSGRKFTDEWIRLRSIRRTTRCRSNISSR